MPTYEYECPKCGEFEFEQRITENALEKCPKCRRKVRRLISRTSFQLKGSGWYVTDYARKDGSGGSSGVSGSTGGSASPEASSETTTPKETSATDTSPKKESKKDTKKGSGSSGATEAA